MNPERISYLLEKHKLSQLTGDEWMELRDAVLKDGNESLIRADIDYSLRNAPESAWWTPGLKDKIWTNIDPAREPGKSPVTEPEIYRTVRFFRTRRLYRLTAAACILVLAGIVPLYRILNRPKPRQHEIAALALHV